MRELVERLREADRNSVQRMNGSGLFGEAADAIQSLEAERDRLREALRPFAELAGTFIDDEGWKHPPMTERVVDWFGPSDFRKARAALGDGEGRE